MTLPKQNNDSTTPPRLARNMRVAVAYRFLSLFELTDAIWVLYLVSRGMNLLQVGLLEGIFHATSILFELPSGVMADRLGRKKTILMGRLCAIASGVIMLTADHFWLFAIAFIFNALGYNCNSGSEEALEYDTMKLLGTEERYAGFCGKMSFMSEAAQGAGNFLGGLLADISFKLSYAGAVFFRTVSFITAFFFTEPSSTKQDNDVQCNTDKANTELAEKKVSLKDHVHTSASIVASSKPMQRLFIVYPLIDALFCIVFFYGQQHLADIGFSKTLIALVLLGVGIIASAGALLSQRILTSFGVVGLSAYKLLLAVGIFCFSLNNPVISVAGFFIATFAQAPLYPVASARLNKIVPSNQRATIISVYSLIFSISMIVLFPLCGALAEVTSLSIVFVLITGLITFIVTPLAAILRV